MNISIHRARINVKSLAAESKFIRKEMGLTKTLDQKMDLYNHKLWAVKPESRIALLALAYLKGKKRKQCENYFKTEIDPVKLFNKLKKFDYTIGINKDESMKKIIKWLTK